MVDDLKSDSSRMSKRALARDRALGRVCSAEVRIQNSQFNKKNMTQLLGTPSISTSVRRTLKRNTALTFTKHLVALFFRVGQNSVGFRNYFVFGGATFFNEPDFG
jgi:hypothetical protein